MKRPNTGSAAGRQAMTLHRYRTPSYDFRMPGMTCSTPNVSERKERDGSRKDGKGG
jgi:hypothetical protein